jgi:hypothetical protein
MMRFDDIADSHPSLSAKDSDLMYSLMTISSLIWLKSDFSQEVASLIVRPLHHDAHEAECLELRHLAGIAAGDAGVPLRLGAKLELQPLALG